MSIGRFGSRDRRKGQRAFAYAAKDFCVETFCTGDVAAQARAAIAGIDQRECPLHPLFMLWFTICISVFRADSIPAVFNRLLTALRDRFKWLPLRVVTDGALAHARRRLGIRPLKRFFRGVGAHFVRPTTFFGYRLRVIDGTHLDLPDTPANVRVFGRRGAGRPGAAALPQLKFVALMDPTTHELLRVKFGSFRASEHHGASRLIRTAIEAGDLVLLDRYFCGVPILSQIRERGAQFLTRAPAHHSLPCIDGRRETGDYRAVMTRRGPGKAVKQLEVRVIEYQNKGFKPVRLVTSLLDPEITAEELIALYHERWEVELAFDELKTIQLNVAGGVQKTHLRSKTPRGVLQEAYALLTAYTLIRRRMAEAAAQANVHPLEIGYADSLRACARAVTAMVGARSADLPRLHATLLEELVACRLRRPQRKRRYDRVVRRSPRGFPVKKPGQGSLPWLDPIRAFREARARPLTFIQGH